MNKEIHFVVVKKEDQSNYTGGPGYKGKELRRLGFPLGPYSRAGAKTLIRQIGQVNKSLDLVMVPYIGEYW